MQFRPLAASIIVIVITFHCSKRMYSI